MKTYKTYTRNGITVLRGSWLAVFVIDGRTVASARFLRHQWGLSIPGHLWPVTADMPIARFNTISGDKITKTPVKRFKSWQACCDEIAAIHASALKKVPKKRPKPVDKPTVPPVVDPDDLTIPDFLKRIKSAPLFAFGPVGPDWSGWTAAAKKTMPYIVTYCRPTTQ